MLSVEPGRLRKVLLCTGLSGIIAKKKVCLFLSEGKALNYDGFFGEDRKIDMIFGFF